MGLWKPTPKDIFKSRWKRFYKRTYRPRSGFNAVDRPTPHEQGKYHTDGVPSPWKLNFALKNFGQGFPPDAMRYSQKAYEFNLRRLLRPATFCNNPVGQDVVLRCLDPGRRQTGADSGYGRACVGNGERYNRAKARDQEGDSKQVRTSEVLPMHIYNLINGEAERDDRGQDFASALKASFQEAEVFPVRRLYELCEEKEIVWLDGQTDPRAMAARTRSITGEETADRGRFPYVDESASLIDELTLKDVLRLAHRTKSRRHPKWREIQYQYKRNHQAFLRRRHVEKDETQARMGVLRQALTQE